MKFIIKHEMEGRIRIHVIQGRMTSREADTLYYYLMSQVSILQAKVRQQTQDVTISYQCGREKIIQLLRQFSYERIKAPESFLQNSGRELNESYRQKLMMHIIRWTGSRIFFPYPLRAAITVVKSVKYLKQGAKVLAAGKLEVPVLDATAIGMSVFRGDMNSASSVMFLLGIGEILEEWTHKKSVDDLARSMSLNVKKVWLLKDEQQILVSSSEIQKDDQVVVHMGNVIPFDGIVTQGEGMVNQSSLTGESVPVRKTKDGYVYAGTVVEEGELTVCVKEIGGSTKFEKITAMIEESEKLKSSMEGKAVHLADRLVPVTLAGTGLTYLLTRNITKALSVLMVDFSCALKLAMPISVLSAIREASLYDITVKGGKFLEAVAEADVIVFDKTGTLTKAKPTVVDVISFNGGEEDELLRIAACMEEHFPHSMAKAVVDAAKKKHLVHEENHSKVEYIVAHGISTTIDQKKAVIGSYHFVFEDEGCRIPEGMQETFDQLKPEHSHLYLAIENILAAVICIEDPLRTEAADVIQDLK